MSGGGLATVAALALLVGAAALACDGDDSPPTTTPISTATVSPTSTATEVPTSTVSSTPTPTPSPEVATREVTGLDAPLGELPEVETLPFPEMPASSFSPWDGQSMMLYDVVEMTERNLGPGQFADFSPDGTRFAWVAGEPGLGMRHSSSNYRTANRARLGPPARSVG